MFLAALVFWELLIAQDYCRRKYVRNYEVPGRYGLKFSYLQCLTNPEPPRNKHVLRERIPALFIALQVAVKY